MTLESSGLGRPIDHVKDADDRVDVRPAKQDNDRVATEMSLEDLALEQKVKAWVTSTFNVDARDTVDPSDAELRDKVLLWTNNLRAFGVVERVDFDSGEDVTEISPEQYRFEQKIQRMIARALANK
ncbi:MAG: hypothetical protein M3Q81_03070 [bacterium]|nr:hypothetical protein [bacterium]